MQVTVRRAGLLAVSRLLRELPDQAAVTELWVRAALPMVRLLPNASYMHCSLTLHIIKLKGEVCCCPCLT